MSGGVIEMIRNKNHFTQITVKNDFLGSAYKSLFTVTYFPMALDIKQAAQDSVLINGLERNFLAILLIYRAGKQYQFQTTLVRHKTDSKNVRTGYAGQGNFIGK